MTNMDDRVYEGLVMRYSGLLGRACGDAGDRGGMPSGRAGGAAASPVTSVPPGKPTTMIDFPSAASTPPVNIMSPGTGRAGIGRTAARRTGAPGRAAAAPAAAPKEPAGGEEASPARKRRARRRRSHLRVLHRRDRARRPTTIDAAAIAR